MPDAPIPRSGAARRVKLRREDLPPASTNRLVHQSVRAEQARASGGTAATKTRGCLGGGREPWRQKAPGAPRRLESLAHLDGRRNRIGPNPAPITSRSTARAARGAAQRAVPACRAGNR